MIRKFLAGLIIGFGMQASAQLPSVNQTFGQVGRWWQDKIENNNPSSIVAFRFIVRCSEGQNVINFDTLVAYGHDHPIPPGGIYVLPVSPTQPNCPAGIAGVIYADGHSEGDPTTIAEMLALRRGVSEGMMIAQGLLDKAAYQGADPQRVAAELRARQKGLNKSVGADEWSGEDYALDTAAQLLEHQRGMHIPSDETPQRQERIDEVMREKNVPFPQAHAIVISRKFKEWGVDLNAGIAKTRPETP